MASEYDDPEEAPAPVDNSGQTEEPPRADFGTGSPEQAANLKELRDQAGGKHVMVIQEGGQPARYATYGEGGLESYGTDRPGTVDPQLQALQQGMPMSPRDEQRLNALMQQYGSVLRDPNFDAKSKNQLLLNMGREIHSLQARQQHQLSLARFQRSQMNNADQAEGMGHSMAQAGMHADWVHQMTQRYGGQYEFGFSDKQGRYMKPRADKPFDPAHAERLALHSVKDDRPELFQKAVPDDFEQAIPDDQKKAWMDKYGAGLATPEAKKQAAAKGWAEAANTARERERDTLVHQRKTTMAAAHGSAGAAPSGGGGSAPPAAGAAPSGGGAPQQQQAQGQPLFNTPQAANAEVTRIADWHKSQLQAVENAHPDDREEKTAAVHRASQLLAKRVHQQGPLSPADADELARMDRIIKREHREKPAPESPRSRNENNALELSGGT